MFLTFDGKIMLIFYAGVAYTRLDKNNALRANMEYLRQSKMHKTRAQVTRIAKEFMITVAMLDLGCWGYSSVQLRLILCQVPQTVAYIKKMKVNLKISFSKQIFNIIIILIQVTTKLKYLIFNSRNFSVSNDNYNYR